MDHIKMLTQTMLKMGLAHGLTHGIIVYELAKHL